MIELINKNEMSKREKYSTEKLIKIIQQWTKEHQNVHPRQEDFDKNPKYPCSVTYISRFGNWNNAIITAGLKPNNHIFRSREAEIQMLSEFKTEGAIDLSGKNRKSSCDGICPRGEKFDTKSALLTKRHELWGWWLCLTNQLKDAEYIFLRAYKDKDFAKKPVHKWRIPIEFMNNKTNIFIHKDKHGMYNAENMKKYEIQ